MGTGEASLAREQYRTFKYLSGFSREWKRLGLTDEDLIELENLILTDPQRGDVIAGTGGLRKLRFAPSRWRRGKSGSLRIGYSHDGKLEKVLMIAVYAKQDKANLTPQERAEIKRILTNLWKEEA